MSWRRKEPGHQQPWYWLCWTELIQSWHVQDYLSISQALTPVMLDYSLRTSDALWHPRIWWTLVQVMACCLTAPNHYLNQCSPIISEVPWHYHLQLQDYKENLKITISKGTLNHYKTTDLTGVSELMCDSEWVIPTAARRTEQHNQQGWMKLHLCMISSKHINHVYGYDLVL